jgi:hypothetical protein
MPKVSRQRDGLLPSRHSPVMMEPSRSRHRAAPSEAASNQEVRSC